MAKIEYELREEQALGEQERQWLIIFRRLMETFHQRVFLECGIAQRIFLVAEGQKWGAMYVHSSCKLRLDGRRIQPGRDAFLVSIGILSVHLESWATALREAHADPARAAELLATLWAVHECRHKAHDRLGLIPVSSPAKVWPAIQLCVKGENKGYLRNARRYLVLSRQRAIDERHLLPCSCGQCLREEIDARLVEGAAYVLWVWAYHRGEDTLLERLTPLIRFNPGKTRGGQSASGGCGVALACGRV